MKWYWLPLPRFLLPRFLLAGSTSSEVQDTNLLGAQRYQKRRYQEVNETLPSSSRVIIIGDD